MNNRESSSPRPHSVLVVDDDPQCRRLVVRMLGELGFGPTHEARSAAEALGVLRLLRPSIVLTDVVMESRGAGMAVFEHARALGIPAGLISGAPLWSETPAPARPPCVTKDQLTLESLGALISELLKDGTPP